MMASAGQLLCPRLDASITNNCNDGLCRGQSQKYSNVLSGLNICFVVAYTAEALLKNAAVGPWKYIKDNW